MNMPIFTKTDGNLDPSQFISIINKVEKDGTSRILGFTPDGTVWELKKEYDYGSYFTEAWSCISSPIWGK